ncbi:hypothetical protein POF45_18510 [Pseudomonas sp. 681]|uniref:Uncharacterized protein n=1 Tax=Pseudomonas fungipugnans TaxID=3024217 RepID=A0ABT6QSY7_9PSED|nr:hypothetical protein [Pseudomonas sp. 681]MDI2593399.1 hypothetical protein [Pseudomonas sp. 681]
MEAAQKVDAALEPLSDAEAEFMTRHHGEIQSFLSQGSTGVGIGSAMFGKHLGNLKETLVELENLHKRTFDKHGKLQGADFFNERKKLMGRLDSSLGPLTPDCGRQHASVRSVAAAVRGHASVWSSSLVSIFLPRA